MPMQMQMLMPEPERRQSEQQTPSQRQAEQVAEVQRREEQLRAEHEVAALAEAEAFVDEFAAFVRDECHVELEHLSWGEKRHVLAKYLDRLRLVGKEAPARYESYRDQLEADERRFNSQSMALKRGMWRQRWRHLLSPTIRTALGFAKVEPMLETVSLETRERLNRAASVLEEEAWQRAEMAQALVVTICHDKSLGQTIVRVTGRDIAEMNIVLPGLLSPAEVARAILGALAPLVRRSLGDRQPVVIFDGDCEKVNMKEAFEGAQVIRSLGHDVAVSAEAILDFVRHPAPTTGNTVVVGGLPATLEEGARVFRPEDEAQAREMWETWAEVAPRWEDAVRSTSFVQAQATGASKEDVLRALVEKSHVIMVVAHAETEEIFLPQPPPTGSAVTGEDLRLIKDQIAANRPLVYLFCCETAAIDKLESVSRVLLECGVAGVIAPRIKLPERRARELMVALGTPRGESTSALEALTEAEARSGCTDMETFVR